MSNFTLFWHTRFESGFPHLDDEHRVIFSLINRLGEAAAQCEFDEFALQLECFASYLRAHFRREEKLMMVTRCPAMERNFREHREVERRLDAWGDRIELCGATVELTKEVFATLHDWMPRHIIEVDAQVGVAMRAARWPVPVAR